MLRYIIGVTLVAAAIMLIRRLAGGRMLKRHQYALWLLIPVYMIVSPFLKISVPVADELSSFIPVTVEKAVYENAYINDVFELEKADSEDKKKDDKLKIKGKEKEKDKKKEKIKKIMKNRKQMTI